MLSDRAIVIMGGTSGIGLASAMACVQHGAGLVVVGKEHEEMKQLDQRLPLLLADVREEVVSNQAIELCLETYGRFDGLLHIAGGSGRKMGDGPLHELTRQGWDYTLELNLTSMMLSNQAAIQQFMHDNHGGSIVNIGSVLAAHPSPGHFTTHAYATAKSAVHGMTRALAAYYASHNIRINAIAPGLIETPMSQRAAKNDEILAFVRKKQPLDGGRIGRPEDLAEWICLLFSDHARFMTGQIIEIDGGWNVSEGL